MHYRLFLTMKAEDRDDALEQAREWMEKQSERLYDWYVIGGRWSGELTRCEEWIKPFNEYVENLSKDEQWLLETMGGSKEEQVKRLDLIKQVQAVWNTHAPAHLQGLDWWSRSSYDEDGAIDDVAPVSQAIYDNLLKEYEGQNNHIDKWNDYFYKDLNRGRVNPKFVGTRWIVVVDYHN